MQGSQTKLLIDASPLSGASRYRGIGTYLHHLIAGLAQRGDLAVSALVQKDVVLPTAVTPVRVRRVLPARWGPPEHEALLPLDLLRSRHDVFHSPALDPPWRSRTPWVQTLHDVIPLVSDDPELRVERRRWRRHAARYRAASAVIAVSRYSAEVGIATLGLDPARVHVIPHGVDPSFRPAATRTDGRPYLLTVGEYSRRKGYPEAFAVIGALAARGYPHVLRVSGRVAPWVEPDVQAVVRGAPAPERVELLGFVDDLVVQYQQADLLLMTSRYEGFGLPILEAMACGIPVVAFANSSITEVVGDAGVLVADGDVEAMVTAARQVLDDPAARADLTARGLERARSFSWERSVTAHVQVYDGLT